MLLFALFILSILILTMNGQCLQEVISNTQYKCGKTTGFDSSSSGFPSKILSGTSELSITGTVKINDMCSATYPFNLLTIKISPENQGEVAIFTFQISSANQVDIYSQDWAGSSLLYPYTWTAAETFGQNTTIEFYVSFNLATGYIRPMLGFGTGWRNYGTLFRNFTGWKFDKTTRFEFCTDSSGNNVVSCTVKTLATEYEYSAFIFRWIFQFLGGVVPVLQGSYTLDQTSGMTVQDKANYLGPAKLGTATSLIPNGKAPKWTTEGGVEFTDPNQYILIPTFKPVSVAPTASFMFTTSFWLKIENETDNNGYIFRYSRSNLTDNLWSISLANNQQLDFQSGTYSYTYPTPISYSTWNLFTISHFCLNWTTTCYTTTYMNSTFFNRFAYYLTDDFSTLFQSSDIVLLGGPNGFKGKIVNFKIFNPGAQRIITPTCESPSGCSLNLGVVESTNKNCLMCTNTTKFYQECRVCPSGYSLSGEDCVKEQEVTTFPGAAASKGTAAAAKATTQAVSAVSSGGSSGATAAISGKVFSNIKFINISYSSELANALETWTPSYISLGFNDNMPDSIETRFVNSTVPYVFAKHQVNSCFLINFWEPLIMLVLLILLLMIVLLIDWAISYCKNDKKSLQYRIITRIKVMILNFLIVQLYGLYGDVVFFALIEFQNQQLTPGLNLLSLFAIVILSGAMLFGFFLHLNLLKRYQNVKRNFGGNAETKQHFDNWIKDHAGIQVIFGDFKDHSLIHQSFLLIMTIRDILFSLILSTLFNHPLVECILILLMNIGMLAYLFIKRPFREKISQIQQVVLELITMVVNISVLILAVFDARNSEAFDQRKTIGKFLIIINMVFNFSVVGFMLVNLFIQGFEIYKDYKSRRQEKRLRVKAPRNIFSLQQNQGSIETRKSPSKALEDNDLKVTDFLRARENPSETCQAMIKTQFDETIILNNLQRTTVNDSMDITIINSTKNANGGGEIDGSIVSPHPSQFSVMGFIRPHDGKRHKIRKIRKGEQFN